MKALIIILLICFTAVLADESYDRMITSLARRTKIPREKAEICANQTKVMIEDMRYFQDSFNLPEESIADKASLKRAACTMSCCAQAKGLMIGAKFQLPQLHEMVNSYELPNDAAAPIHQAVDSCTRELIAATDECLVVRDLARCMSDKLEDPHIV